MNSAKDSKSNLITVDEITGKTNDSVAFTYSNIKAEVTASSYFYWPVRTKTAKPNCYLKFSTNHAGRLSIYGGCSFTITAGKTATAYNRDRSSSNACLTQFVSCATTTDYGITTTGTAIYTQNVNAGDYDLGKYILATSADYLIEFLNAAGETASASIMIDFYE